jgi:hypothetical protein
MHAVDLPEIMTSKAAEKFASIGNPTEEVAKKSIPSRLS